MATQLSAVRAQKCFRKTITFDGTAGNGAVGTVAVATTTGTVNLDVVNVVSTTSLTGATATIEMGVAGTTNGIIAQATATNLTAGKSWTSATPAVIATPVTNKVVTGNIIITVGTAAVATGVIEVEMYYRPLTSNGYLA